MLLEGQVEGNVVNDTKPKGMVSSCARLDRAWVISNLIAVRGNTGDDVRAGPGEGILSIVWSTVARAKFETLHAQVVSRIVRGGKSRFGTIEGR